MYFKMIEDGYIIAVTTNHGQTPVEEREYRELLGVIRNMPDAPDGYTYRLRADTLAWELAELPPEPEPSAPTTDDIINTLFGGGVE